MGKRPDEIGRPEGGSTSGEDRYVVRPGESMRVKIDGTRTVEAAETRSSSTPPTDDRDVAEIRAEMKQTRAEMSETSDVIQDRLSPQELKDQAKETAREVSEQVADQVQETAVSVTEQVKEAIADATGEAKHAVREATGGRVEHVVSDAGHTARGVSSSMIDMIKQNPVPAALIGIGLGWLYMNRGNSGVDYAYRAERVGGPYGERRTVVRVDNASAGQGVTSKVGETASQAQDKAEDLASSASHMASEAASSAGHMASEAASAAGDVASTAGYRARDLSTTIMDTIKQNPVPAAPAGISLAWLYKNSSSASTTG